MKTIRVIYHLARADFYERIRRYSFLITLGLSALLAYQTAIGNLSVRLGTYRGEFNSAWVGSMVALIATFFFGWFGFYLIKGSIQRDRDTGVGEIIATTPLTRPVYAVGKWISNIAVFMAMLTILAIATIGIQFLAGESMHIELVAMYSPFLFVAIPLLALVAAIAVLFETIGFLRGGFGNIVYFFLFIVLLAGSMELTNSAIEPTGMLLFQESMGAATLAKFPDYQGGFVLGASPNSITDTFQWDGVEWTANLVMTRFSLIGAALIVVMLAAIFFDRFDTSRYKKFRRVKEIKKSDTLDIKELESTNSVSSITFQSIAAATSKFSFFNAYFSELKLLIKGQKWWWYAIAGGLIVAGFVNEATVTQEVILPITWIWPILIWSSMGNRESRHNMQQLVFSSTAPLWRQIPTQWLAGFTITIGIAIGAIIRFAIEGDVVQLIALLSGAIFIPSLALVSGVWSGSSKPFEILYLLIWYMGPMNRIPALDYVGVTTDGSPQIFIPLSLLLILVSIVGRSRQIQK